MKKKCNPLSLFGFIVVLLYFVFLPSQVFADPSENLIFTEIQYHAYPLQQGEWLEIFNPTANPVSMKDWLIEDNNAEGFTFPDIIFKPGDYLLMPRKTSKFESNYGGSVVSNLADNVIVIERRGKALSNQSGMIMLKDSSGNLIDKVSWGGNEGWDVKAKKGQTLARSSSKDTNDASQWEKIGEKKAVNGTPGGGDYVTHDEFFEIGDFAPKEETTSSSPSVRRTGGNRRYARIQSVGPFVVRTNCSKAYCPEGSAVSVSVILRQQSGTTRLFASL